ncbi:MULTISPECIES: TauD/TfdA dioxygenase family protein [Agrobacterium tumefaciens complex]|jgi:taurine dioxygenase|uniref:TauD/TfdA dioxygenase family protein n=1 Tax=Agrobacterium tumefaciens TaxID=358 RepID=UPI0013875BF1|nr:TauD/TfdA family dioxygenase [Agrobacterium tumefaciens]
MKRIDLTTSFASAIEDFDAQRATDEELRQLQELVYSRKVVAIKDQKIDRKSYQDFAARFGSLEPFKLKNYHDPEFPSILVINNLNRGQAVGARKLGNMWHSDSSYLATPLALTFLHAQRVPENAGDTLFVDTEAALADLPGNLLERIKSRHAEHDVRWTYKVKETDIGESISEIFARIGREFAAAVHPTIITHPVTGRNALYLNPGYSSRIRDYSESESRTLLDEVFSQVLQPDRIFAYRWAANDILIWDNRSVIHSATDIPDDADRLMHRIGVNDREFFGNVG